MLCDVYHHPDELEERRVYGGVFKANLINDLESYDWSPISAWSHNPTRQLLFYLRTFPREIPRRFVVRGVMSDFSPQFFDRQLRHPDTFAVIREMKAAGQRPVKPTGVAYVDILINALYFLLHIDHNMPPKAVNAVYYHIDELLGYTPAVGLGKKLVPFTAACLPDLTVLMPMIPAHRMSKRDIAHKFPDSNRITVTVIENLLDILSKLMPHRCNSREYFKVLQHACDTHPVMCEVIAKILIASWLGVYEFCTVKAPLDVRVKVYATAISRTQLGLFFTQDTSIIMMYMFKEYFCELFHRFPGFTQSLDDYNWTQYYSCTRDIGDTCVRVRGSVPYTFFGFPAVNIDINSKHDAYRKWQKSSNIQYDLAHILEIFDDIDYNNYPLTRADSIYPPGQEYLLPSPHLFLEQERLDLLQQCVLSLLQDKEGMTSKLSFEWLVCFGASLHWIRELKMAVMSTAPTLRKLLVNMRLVAPENYCIFYSFFTILARANTYIDAPGDIDMMLAHTRAIGLHYGIGDGERIPEVAGCLLVCDNCGDVKQSSFWGGSGSGSGSGHSSGFGKTCITGSGELMCARRPAAPDWNDVHFFKHGKHSEASTLSRQRSTHAIGTPETIKRKFAKHVASQISLHRCITQRLRRISTLGRIAMYRGTVYIACFRCPNIAPVDMHRFYDNEILCKNCVTVVVSKKEKEYRTCVLCGLASRAQMRCYYVYDDVGAEKGFRHIHICVSHNPLSWVIPGQMVFLSRILLEVKRKCGKMGQDGEALLPLGVGPVSSKESDSILGYTGRVYVPDIIIE